MQEYLLCGTALHIEGPWTRMRLARSMGLRRPGCSANTTRKPRLEVAVQSTRTDARSSGQGRSTPTCAIMESCRRLTLGRPESRLHKQGPCGFKLRVSLRLRPAGCHSNEPRCRRLSNSQGPVRTHLPKRHGGRSSSARRSPRPSSAGAHPAVRSCTIAHKRRGALRGGLGQVRHG